MCASVVNPNVPNRVVYPVLYLGVSKNPTMPSSGVSPRLYTYGTVGHPAVSMAANNAGSITFRRKGPNTGPALSGCVVINVIVYG